MIGIAFKWTPDRALYVVDRARERLAVLHLTDDARHLKVARVTHLSAPELRQPVDLAAALPEVANPRFASHTTLAGGSDLYVANRGDGSLVRIDQDGRVLARAEIRLPGLGPLGPDRLRALAVSADAQRIWLTVQGELPGFAGHEGALIEVSAFDANGPFRRTEARAGAGVDMKLVRSGRGGVPPRGRPGRRAGTALQRALVPRLPQRAERGRHEHKRREFRGARGPRASGHRPCRCAGRSE